MLGLWLGVGKAAATHPCKLSGWCSGGVGVPSMLVHEGTSRSDSHTVWGLGCRAAVGFGGLGLGFRVSGHHQPLEVKYLPLFRE